MIFLNEITLAGAIENIKRNKAAGLTRVFVSVPMGDVGDEQNGDKTVQIPVDLVGEHHAQAEIYKVGDFFACKAQLINLKMRPDDQDKDFTVWWPQALATRRLVHIPDGGKYAPAAYNDVSFAGRVQRISDLMEVGAKKTKMCIVTVTFVPKLDKNASAEDKKAATVYLDAAFFGSTAEKYIKPYCAEKDLIHVHGNLSMFEEKWKVKGKAPMSVRVNARDAKFIGVVDRDGGGKKTTDKPNYDAYKNGGADMDGGGDDNLPL